MFQIRNRQQRLVETVMRHVRRGLLRPSSKVDQNSSHIPVLLDQVAELLSPALDCRDEPIVIDMTFGSGGHTREILRRWPRAKLICLDRDPAAFERCKAMHSPRITPLQGRFRDITSLLGKSVKVDAMLFDLGVSSPQLDNASRGFSLSQDGPLDMRMDGDSDEPTAADVINQLSFKDLTKIIKTYGEERNADEIARVIVDWRHWRGPISRTWQLARLVKAVSGLRRDKLGRFAHPATKTFQALRIFVNDELNELCCGLDAAHDLLRPKTGRCAVISFHSLEDRIVKRFFHAVNLRRPLGVDRLQFHATLRTSCEPFSADQMAALIDRKWRPLTAKCSTGGFHNSVITPSRAEIAGNPRARSAKLRVAEKL